MSKLVITINLITRQAEWSVEMTLLIDLTSTNGRHQREASEHLTDFNHEDGFRYWLHTIAYDCIQYHIITRQALIRSNKQCARIVILLVIKEQLVLDAMSFVGVSQLTISWLIWISEKMQPLNSHHYILSAQPSLIGHPKGNQKPDLAISIISS